MKPACTRVHEGKHGKHEAARHREEHSLFSLSLVTPPPPLPSEEKALMLMLQLQALKAQNLSGL